MVRLLLKRADSHEIFQGVNRLLLYYRVHTECTQPDKIEWAVQLPGGFQGRVSGTTRCSNAYLIRKRTQENAHDDSSYKRTSLHLMPASSGGGDVVGSLCQPVPHLYPCTGYSPSTAACRPCRSCSFSIVQL